MRRALLGLAMMAACSPFGTADGPPATNTTPPPTPTPTPTPDAAAPTSDAGVPPDADGAAPACANGAVPIIQFAFDFANGLGDGQTEVEGTGANSTPILVGGLPVLRSTGKPPGSSGNGLKATARWYWSVGGIRTATVGFDYRGTYSLQKVFAEIGCRLSLQVPGAAYSSVGLVFDDTEDPIVRLTGREPIGDGPNTQSFRPAPNFPLGSFDASMRRATIEVTIVEGGTSSVIGRIDGGSPASGTFRTPLAIDGVTLQCGIIFADNSDQGVVSVDVTNVSLVACP